MTKLIDKWQPVLDKLPKDIKDKENFVQLLENEHKDKETLEDFTRFVFPMCTEIWRKLEKLKIKIETQKSSDRCVMEVYGPTFNFGDLDNKKTAGDIAEYLSEEMVKDIVKLTGGKTFKPFKLFVANQGIDVGSETEYRFLMQYLKEAQ